MCKYVINMAAGKAVNTSLIVFCLAYCNKKRGATSTAAGCATLKGCVRGLLNHPIRHDVLYVIASLPLILEAG